MAPAIGVGVERDADVDAVAVSNPRAHLSIPAQRESLAIHAHRRELLYAIDRHRCVVVSGQTGSGKSTQIPQYLYEAGWAKAGYRIACSQPRVLAAVTVANRVAYEMGTKPGGVVGYAVPFDNCTSDATRVTFLTDTVLISEMMADPLLTAYSVVMVDEAHERNLETDVLLGLLNKIRKKRPELRVVVASATIDTDLFCAFFGGDTVAVGIGGAQYPVDVVYLDTPTRNYIDRAVQTVVDIHRRMPPGDVLVFLPGRSEVDEVVSRIKDVVLTERNPTSWNLRALPMYAGLATAEQLKAIEPDSSCRKAIVSTNVCETSVTIPSVVYVVDSGFVKQDAFDPRTGFQSLHTVPISQASAMQRAGRAGRLRHGQVYRLYTEAAFEDMQTFTPPAVLRQCPHPMLLQLKCLGVTDLVHFEYVTPPTPDCMASALQLLYALDALDDGCHITDVGIALTGMNVSARLGRSLLDSAERGCSSEMIDIAAMLCVRNVWTRPRNREYSGQSANAHKKFAVAEGDLLSLLNVYRAWDQAGGTEQWCTEHWIDYRALRRAAQIRQRITKLFKRDGRRIVSCGDDASAVMKSIATGFFMNCAFLQNDGTYTTLITAGSKVQLRVHPLSVLAGQSPQWVLYYDCIDTDGLFMRDITRVNPALLKEIAPKYFGTVS
ncbi:hypothetical protein PBRA_001102 [Plasmodiophora brassicae]|nr:hypothetical protein PBRA_001102 [Plasmodiophora brassicae]